MPNLKTSSDPHRILQCSFNTGEISPDVANRVDMDKYKYALLRAKNVMVRPFGGAYKRSGMMYCSATKNNGAAILVPFASGNEFDYLLEIGAGYIRVHKDGEYLGVEMETPFTVDILPKLRFTQSADIMYITSGDYPVKELARYSETDWRFRDFVIDNPYFDDNIGDVSEDCTLVPSAIDGADVTITSTENLFNSNMVGSSIKLTQDVDTTTASLNIANTSAIQPFTGTYYTTVLTSPELARVSVSGDWTGTITLEKWNDAVNVWETVQSWNSNVSSGDIEIVGLLRLKAEVTNSVSINATITAGQYVRKSWITMFQQTGEEKISRSGEPFTVSESVYVGDTWKIQTSGTWSGTITIERSFDNNNWKTFRKYTSENNGNYTESGTVTTRCYLRLKGERKSNSEKSLQAELQALSYSHDGWATITEYIDARNVTVSVDDKFGTINPTKKWALSPWSKANGYPRTSAFFQDRLVFGGTKLQPYMVWMSRTGDYGNFSIEKAGGKVTDDSAIAVSLISRKQYEILHLVPSNDLLVITSGNEWIISGGEVASPTNISPKLQTTRGCNECEPMFIGGKLVYVQARGTTVRDFGYRYEVDHYDGSDLTLLAKHITRKGEIIDSAYKQEPDSTVYFVRDDGIICCLTYIDEQKVYAWSTIETDGKIEAVSSIQQGAEDFVYAVVQREVNGEAVRYIEKLANNPQDSKRPNDYVMLDSSVHVVNDEPTDTFTVEHLAGKYVDILGDGQMYLNYLVESDGVVSLPSKVKDAVIGLRYAMEMEMTNIEITLSGSSIMGLQRYVGNVMLRLENTLGGSVGPQEELQDVITYDEFATAGEIVLYNGDKNVVLPMGGFNQDGRVWIESVHPYPFSVLSVVREVLIGG